MGVEDDAWHILFKYFENGHISDHLCLSLDLISKLLKQTGILAFAKIKVAFANIS